MDAFSELAAVSRARGCGPVPIAYPLSGTGPSKPLGEGGIAYPSGAQRARVVRLRLMLASACLAACAMPI